MIFQWPALDLIEAGGTPAMAGQHEQPEHLTPGGEVWTPAGASGFQDGRSPGGLAPQALGLSVTADAPSSRPECLIFGK